MKCFTHHSLHMDLLCWILAHTATHRDRECKSKQQTERKLSRLLWNTSSWKSEHALSSKLFLTQNSKALQASWSEIIPPFWEHSSRSSWLWPQCYTALSRLHAHSSWRQDHGISPAYRARSPLQPANHKEDYRVSMQIADFSRQV